jgi:two-component system CheB/CheR fusion protein
MAAISHTRLFQYTVAAAGMALATAVRHWLDPVLEETHPFLTYYLAIVFIAWACEMGPTILAILLGSVAATYFFLTPRWTTAVHQVEDQIAVGVFVFFGAVTAVLSQQVRRTRQRLERKQRQLEQEVAQRRDSERIYRAIGESIDYGVWISNREGRNTYTSESFLRLVGLTPEQCSGFGWVQLLHPDEAEATVAAWKECIKTGEFWDYEHRYRGVDGKWHPILGRGVPVRDERGEILCWAGINLDISRLKAVEEALREADRRKDEFLAVLAHELRNPLAPLRTALHVLRHTGLAEETFTRMRDMMERQVRQMTRLVDDLLDISRIGRGKIELRQERLDLATVIHSALETSEPLIEAGRHELTVSLPDQPLDVTGDPARLSQVLANLLNNAAKYTADGGHIRLTARREGNQVVVRVRDNGAGIASEVLPHVFEMFMQSGQLQDRSEGGLGIGLTLVRRLVELHGGSVTVHSNGPGTGSEFVVRLPAAPDAPDSRPLRRQEPEEEKAPVSPPRRILVVDDNRDAAESLVTLLQIAGHEVRLAHDGPRALATAREFLPDVVLLDIGMPGMSGYQVAQRIREEPELRHVTLIAQTGWGQEEDRRRAQAAGFDHYLVKPLVPRQLHELIARLPAPLA